MNTPLNRCDNTSTSAAQPTQASKSSRSSILKFCSPVIARKYSLRALRMAPDIAMRASAAALALFALFGFNPQTLAATDYWVGSAGSTDWNTGADWLATTVPASGDTLVFTSTNASTSATLTDTLTSTSFILGGTGVNSIVFNPGAVAYTMTGNAFQVGSGILDDATNLETIDNPISLPATHSIVAGVTGADLVFGGVISGAGGETIAGPGTVTLTNANTYTGTTTVSSGTLLLNYAAGGAPTTNIISASSALNLGGGTLQVSGANGVANSQTFASTAVTAGQSVISVAPSSGTTLPTVVLGALAEQGVAGADVEYVGPATIGASNVAVPATGIITTTSPGSGTSGAYYNAANTSSSVEQDGATVGLYDWASSDTTAGTAGTSPYTIIGGSQVTGFYQTTGITTAGAAYDYNPSGVNNLTTGSSDGLVRFNYAGPGTITNSTGTASGIIGFLITPNVGANNDTLSGGGLEFVRATGAVQGFGTIVQNNTLGYFNVSLPLTGGREAAQNNALVQDGPGTVVYTGVNTYEGATILNGGDSVVIADSGFGAVADAGQTITHAPLASDVDLNGGTVVGNATFTMDNVGSNKRPINLLGNGGGLAATAGNTMTIDGLIESTISNNLPLVIGIPASSANGNVAGLLPGSGTGTANTTAVMATGTVVLNAGNGYFGGTVIDSGVLNINGINALGGADYGGTTLNGGTVQYAAGATGTANGSLDLTSIGTSGLSITANGGTIDTNGDAVTYAGSIGNNGTGTLTVTSTIAGGSLTLNGNNTFTGGLTVTSGTLALGGANVNSGATNVNGGTLQLKAGSSLGSSAITVATGASLVAKPTGSTNINMGSTGATLTLSSNSSLSLTANDADTTDSLTLNSAAGTGGGTVFSVGGSANAANISFQLGSAGNDEIVINGGLTAFGADGGKIFITDLDTNTPLTTYTLVSDASGGILAGGTTPGADFWLGTTGLTLGSNSYGLSLSAPGGTSLVLTVSLISPNYYWTGTTSTWGTLSNFVTAATGGTTQTTPLSATANVFLTANTAGNLTQTLDGNYTVNSLSFTGSGTAGTSPITLGNGTGTALTINAANNFVDSASNSYAAGTGIVVQPGAAADIINANINLGNSQTWLVNNSASSPLTVNGVIADSVPGSGDSLTMTGAGKLILNNAETYDGPTIVAGGTLALGSSGSIPTTSTLTVTGTGTFDLGGNTVTVAKLTDGSASTGTITSSNGTTPATLIINNTVANSFSGTITDTNATNGASLALSLVGTSNVTLSGSNSFTGGTSLTSGNLTVSNNYGLGSVTSVNPNAGLLMNPAAATTSNVYFTSANPQVALLNNGAAGGTSNVILGNASGTTTTLNIGNGGINGTSESLFGGTISDLTATVPAAIGSLNVENGGFVVLTGANTFTGTTTITGAGSLLQLQNALALQDSTLNYNNQGGTLQFSGISSVTLGGLSGAQNLALTNVGSSAVALTIGNNNVSPIYTGNLSGLGSLTKVGNGTVQIGSGAAGGASYAGTTFVNTGNLILGGTTNLANAIDLPAFGADGVTIQDSAVVNMGTATFYVDSNDGGNGNNYPGVATVTIDGNASVTAGGFSFGHTSRVATGGSLTLAGTATLDIQGPVAVVSTEGSTASTTTYNLNGGTMEWSTLTFGGNGTTQLVNMDLNGTTLEPYASDSPTAYYYPAFTGLTAKVEAGGAIFNTVGFDDTIAVALTSGVAGDGGLTVKDTVGGGILTLIAANTYLGATTINAGGTLQLGNGTTGDDGTIQSSSGITDNGSLIYNRFSNLTSAVPITGTGTVAKIGAGEEVLSALNNYTGATSVSAGTLEVTGSLSATASVSVSGGATLELGDNNALNAVAPITLNTGLLQVLATQTEALGTLTLSGGGADTLTLGASGDVINFADSSALAWTGSLVIADWNGASAGGGSDEVFFGTTNDLTAAQLADITFTNGTLDGNAFTTYQAIQLSDGEIVASAIPEPGTWAMLFAGAGMLCVWQRTRRTRGGTARRETTTV